MISGQEICAKKQDMCEQKVMLFSQSKGSHAGWNCSSSSVFPLRFASLSTSPPLPPSHELVPWSPLTPGNNKGNILQTRVSTWQNRQELSCFQGLDDSFSIGLLPLMTCWYYNLTSPEGCNCSDTTYRERKVVPSGGVRVKCSCTCIDLDHASIE